MPDCDVAIIGGGVAGLACASELVQRGISCRLFEASRRVGGRIRTDQYEGFLLDRGFQVLLDSYPECQRQLDFEALNLRRFGPGALIRFQGRFHRFVDPWRAPQHALSTLMSPTATLGDKWRLRKFRREAIAQKVTDVSGGGEVTSLQALQSRGMSDRILQTFFKPFFGGVFLESTLQTTSRKLDFLFRMFATGSAALPNRGMEQIPLQLASRLPAGVVSTEARVMDVRPQAVGLESGRTVTAQAVVLATEKPVTDQLLADSPPAPGHGVWCLYYAAPAPPVSDPILVLNGEGTGPINHLCCPSQVAPGYAPEGEHLISVSVLPENVNERDELELAVRSQLGRWFGETVNQWRHLKTYEVPFALPRQPVGATTKPGRHKSGLYVCGDHTELASINGAMLSGRLCAEELLKLLG